MKPSVKQTIVRAAILFVCLIAFYFIAMSAVYFIPSESIDKNFNEGAKFIYSEGEYYEPFFGKAQARLDGTTDIIMMLECQQREDPNMNPFQAAMYINGYSRFWHGYQIFLRPMLTFMSYIQIRYINSFIFFIALCLAFASVKKHISTLTAVLFIVTLMMTFSFLAPMNMQYMSAYMITLVSIIVMLKYKEKFSLVYLLFFAAGSAISFFDFLTFPLLTLGLPLGVLLFAREKTMERTAVKKIIDIVISSVMWGLGYAFTWISKWALGTWITGVNIFDNAAGETMYRMMGNEKWPLDRKMTYWVNVFQFLTKENLIIAAILIIVLVALIIIGRKKFKQILKPLPIFIVAMYPYAWYFVFSNHSQYHSFFTYRSQMMSVFIGFAFLAQAVDMERVKVFFSSLFKKKKEKSLLPEDKKGKEK